MRFLESRANNVFLKAVGNLCELESIKEYDADMKLKSEHKMIKLKDSVLKDYISKISKEAHAKNSNTKTAAKTAPVAPPDNKAKCQTARTKGTTNTSQPTQTKQKDNFLVSSLMSAGNFFQKRNRNIILILMDKMVDKYCSCNFENWTDAKDSKTGPADSQCIYTYAVLMDTLSKIVKTFPSTASLIMLFKSK